MKGTYNFLSTIDEPLARGLFDDVSLFAWRLLRNPLPTKDNLVRRRVLQHDGNRCVGGWGNEETAGHLFLGCPTFGSVCSYVLQWLGITFVAADVVSEHVLQFGHLLGSPRFTHLFLKLMSFVCLGHLEGKEQPGY